MAADCRGVFITGTDTGCGKTRVTIAIMSRLKQEGLRVGGMKPVASGCETIGGQLVNDDAMQIRNACSFETSYDRINPWALRDPIAPHIAAKRQGQHISAGPIIDACRHLERYSDVIVVEGVGGWRVPLDKDLDQAGLAEALGMPLILVVGLRLGCINHARLTVEAIRADGIQLSGWIANHPYPDYETGTETLDYLANIIEAPLLGEVPFQKDHNNEFSTARLDLDLLLQGKIA